MFNLPAKQIQAMAPLMERVLVVDRGSTSARLVGDLLRHLWPSQIWTASTVAAGLTMAESLDPRLIFVEHDSEHLDGLAFTRRLRRSAFSCRKAPVIMITAQATPAVILGARDAGVHEFLRKPFTSKDLMRRLEAVSLQSRSWVEAIGYVGPDRRRFNSADYKGARKRRVDAAATPEQARMAQALRIVAAAQAALDSDRPQAVRALRAQAKELLEVAQLLNHAELQTAAAGLQAFLAQATQSGVVTAEGLAPQATRLLALQPKPEPRSRDAA